MSPRRGPGGLPVVALAVTLQLVSLTGAGAQASREAPGARPPREAPRAREPLDAPGAAPYLAADHWLLAALRRLEGAGLLPPGYDRGLWSVDRAEAAALLDRAVDRARADRPELVPLAAGYRARFRQEAPAAFDALREPGRWRMGRGSVSAGVRRTEGGLRTALGSPPYIVEPPEPMDPETAPAAGVDLSGYGGARWAGRVSGVVDGDGVESGESYALVRLGAARVWAGRRRPRLGPGEGGVVLGGAAPVDGLGLDTRSFHLPWLLERLGPVRVAMQLGRIGSVEPFGEPWLWVLRGSVQPHPRLTVGLNRAAMLAATDQYDLEWLKQVAYVLVGKHPAGELDREDNQVASVDLSYRPPLSGLPVTVYLEWGFEDSAGAWRDVPGIVGGVHLAAVPRLPSLAVGVEGARFAPSCCGNPWWYRHRGFTGGWTADRRPLGHLLGGEGTEIAVRADLSLLDARALVGGRVYRRERGAENLYAPTREGRSTGASVEASLLPRSNVRLRLRAEHEAAPDRDRSALELMGELLF